MSHHQLRLARSWKQPLLAVCILLGLLAAAPATAQTTNPNVIEFLPSTEDSESLSSVSSVTYVSDLTFVAETNGWGPVERDRSNGENGGGDGGTLTLNGVTYSKGLGVHAISSVLFDVPSDCTRFSADIGVDDEAGANGSVVFQVAADGTTIFTSNVMTGSSATTTVSVDITGRRQLTLAVSDGGDEIYFDHADWANARLTCGSSGAVVQRYDVAFYQAGAFEPFMLVNIGKPAIQPDGMARADLSSLFSGWPMPNTDCEARVIAVGKDGPAVSYPSNSFVYGCSFALSSTSKSFDAGGGTGSVALTSESYCGWSVSTTASWITISAGNSGSGAGTISYSVAPNTSLYGRSGVVSIAGLTYVVAQSGATVAPPPQDNLAPAVKITRPAAGTLVKVGRAVNLEAEATDSDGVIRSVRFFVNDVVIGESTVAPYRVTWTPPTRGSYSISAVATDDDGAQTQSQTITVKAR